MEQFSQERQSSVIERLNEVVAERDRSEASLRATHSNRDETAEAQFVADRERLEAEYRSEKEQCSKAQTVRLAAIANDYERAFEVVKNECDVAAREVTERVESALSQAQQAHKQAYERAEQVYAQEVEAATRVLQEKTTKISAEREELEALAASLDKILRQRRCRRAATALPELSAAVNNRPAAFFKEQLSAAKLTLSTFPQQRAARFLGSGGPFVIFIFTWILAIVIATLVTQIGWPWVIATGAVALGVATIVYVLLRPIVVRQTLALCQQMRQHQLNAQHALDGCRALAGAEADQRRYAQKQQRQQQRQDADRLLQQRAAELQAEKDSLLKDLAERLQTRRKELAHVRSSQQRAVNDEFEQQFEQLQERFDLQTNELKQKHGDHVDSSSQAFARSRERAAARWEDGYGEFLRAAEAARDYCDQHFPRWDVELPQGWAPPSQSTPVVRFGEFLVRVRDVDHGAGELPADQASTLLPAVHSFASRPALLWQAWGEGRDAANRSMRNVMLRLLTSLPPGKTRYTIIDPVGLGQNFSAFMHLADFDEKLVSHRIWTDPAHINQRLTNLTEHMEDIIQTYLRNEYETIDQYNQYAGEVAEPFHVLSIANFPAGFSDEAAARLLSIVNSGVQCGVFTVISLDSKLELPRGFELADLENQAVTLQWHGTGFRWLDPVLQELELTLDEPPPEEHFTTLVCEVGQRAQEANRVEVPFATVAPPEQEWWSEDSRAALRVPLGRAGATKLQYLQLGHGTSQHVLISGKTGSGKSTLLHALIMNTALHYSPHEVEFYLVDFKKGVEFKPYAESGLPHASVVAIESEREFGISVLQRLDVELQRRGDLFREQRVQDIHSYRDAFPELRMPRVLLIVDEFQELFVQDDKLAQDAALLLDRLVRQGRAFGIHVLLGSQTLAGAYSLARSTIGQMAVRIALQCSEADSHLILSEDNMAARLLDRPGEAIYNDQNGLFEGNHPFQVVWLAAREQDRYLQELAEFAAARDIVTEPPIVFEGNMPANPAENPLLRESLESPPQTTALATAWLGAAVAIKDPTAVVFRRQGGANLVVVGQQEPAALGVLSTALLSLAATCPLEAPESARFIILDGTRHDDSHPQTWKTLAARMPAEVDVFSPAESPDPLSRLHAELQTRTEAPDEGTPSIFLFIFNLARFRDLRRADDDFGFGGFDTKESLTPSQQLVELLRDGPAVGIHTLVWCDSYNNLNRWFDRQTQRELDQRLLFQMSATDSSNLMDSPAASRLGPNRAILFSEDQGLQEKFRPYGVPTAEWLDEVDSLFRAENR